MDEEKERDEDGERENKQKLTDCALWRKLFGYRGVGYVGNRQQAAFALSQVTPLPFSLSCKIPQKTHHPFAVNAVSSFWPCEQKTLSTLMSSVVRLVVLCRVHGTPVIQTMLE